MKTNLTTSMIEAMTAEAIEALGTVWTKKGSRLYLSDEFKLSALGLEVERYHGGAVSSAKQHGEKISNTKAMKLIDSCRRTWVDLETGELMDVTLREAEELLSKAIDAAVEATEKDEVAVVGSYVDVFSRDTVEIVEKDDQFYQRYEGEALTGPRHVDGRPLTRETMRSLKAVRPFGLSEFTLPSGRVKEVLRCETDQEAEAFSKVFSEELAAADDAARETIREIGRQCANDHWEDYRTRYTRYFPERSDERHLQDFAEVFGPKYFMTIDEVKGLLKKEGE